jgi:chromosome segregation ATPase
MNKSSSGNAPNQESVTEAIHAMGDHIAGVINDLASNMDERFADLETNMDERFDAVDKRFEQMDERFEQMDERFEQMDERFEQMDGRFGEAEGRLYKLEKGQTEIAEKLDNLDGRVESIENDIKEIYTLLQKAQKKIPDITKNEVDELQARMTKIIQWAERVSAKTGIPLPQL